MRERLLQLGWSEVEVIDEDLGCSAAGGTLRARFERMSAKVCLGEGPDQLIKVGSYVRSGRSRADQPARPVRRRRHNPGME